jgi:hypothetical protein
MRKTFGGPFLRQFYQNTGGILHFLDPVELLRIVQTAELISSRSKMVTQVMAFDYYFMEQLKRTATSEEPGH